MFGIPGGEALLKGGGVKAFEMMAALCKQGVTVVFERAGAHRFASHDDEASLVVERFGPVAVPGVPAGKGIFHQSSIEGVSTVVHADDFGDVGGGRVRVRQGAGVEKSDGMAPAAEFERGGDAKDARADDDNGRWS